LIPERRTVAVPEQVAGFTRTCGYDSWETP
jgi:hypothetical protein